MNVFVAGIHGVGKTHLASRIPASLGLTHTSASKLIKEERAMPTWGSDKRVSQVDANQVALATAVSRHNGGGFYLLLDGHFVLLNKKGDFQPLEVDVFRALNLKGVILLEATPETVALRIQDRDGRNADLSHIAGFLSAERAQAQKICDALDIPLRVLEQPSLETFTEEIRAILKPSIS
ncbi:ATP-binding protein [Pseudomonas sp. WS 5146]|uniref:ATP-binding protein n=1 Tax=Pseudomonas sp. WS 5146 TaxID=2717494 RepID=UPI0014751DBF|nr:ATP-binding protein [Pseudomonas sp. WS 5146]NMX59076.1 AAA family ATPase [Pseudomonas sp. WS 5146]